MKLIVCGKGGSGKSVISALLAKHLAKRRYKVLVIDNDESNFGLHHLLGMEIPEDFTRFFGGKKSIGEKLLGFIREVGIKKEPEVEFLEKGVKFDDIPERYLSQKGNIKLLAVGKIHEFGEGCACPINALSKELLKNLRLKEGEIAIVDADAGTEHFGRGIEEGIDLVLMTIDPTYESVALAKKVVHLASGQAEVYYVVNKYSEEIKDAFLNSIDLDRVVTYIPLNKDIFRASLEGRELSLDLIEIEQLSDWVVKKI